MGITDDAYFGPMGRREPSDYARRLAMEEAHFGPGGPKKLDEKTREYFRKRAFNPKQP